MATVSTLPHPQLCFASLRGADSYASGFCSRRVVVVKLPREYRPFHVCAPSTARRRGWKVVAS